jgi:hypothetical protein
VLSALCLGCGLLVERAAGMRLPGALLVPLGLAVIMALAGLATASQATAKLAWPLVLVAAIAAIAGFVLARRRERRLDPWAIGAALAIYLVFSAPYLLSGENTFGGYIKLDDTATWLNITDQVMSHGRDLSSLPQSSYEHNLAFYLGTTGYPLGSFLPLGVARPLVGTDIAWLFQPYLSFLAASLGLALIGALSGLIASARFRAVASFVASCSALVFAFAMWGGVKELASTALVALVAALVPRLLAGGDRWREVLPLVIAAVALLSTLGPGAGPWLIPALAAALGLLLWRRSAAGRDMRATLVQVGAFAGISAVLALPTWLLTQAFIKGGGPLYTGNGLFNLKAPLSPFQVVGIWPAGDFRDPTVSTAATVILIGVALGALVLGLDQAVRRFSWGVPVYVVTAVFGCLIVAAISSPWVTAKGLVTASPALLLAAAVGAWVVAVRWGRAAGAVVMGLLLLGVVWSDVLAYGKVNLAPAPRLRELQSLAPRLAGRGPTLVTEPEIYADRHFLRDAAPEGASDLRLRPILLSGGQSLIKEAYADIDSFAPAALSPYRTIVARVSPVQSRPPYPYRLTWRGRWYEAWDRPAVPGPRLIEHVALGDNAARPYCGLARVGAREVYAGPCGVRPAAVPSCGQIRGLAAGARKQGAHLLALPRENPVVLEPTALRLPEGWRAYPASGLAYMSQPGAATGVISVPAAGRYVAWLGGSFGRGFEVSLDGRRIGGVHYRLNDAGQYEPLAELPLAAGAHRVELRQGGAGLHPGSAEAGDPLGPFVLELLGAAGRVPVTVDPRHAEPLCGKSLDWVEIVAGR